MSVFSKLLGLDHPSNKPLLDVLNGVGRAFASKAGLENADPGKLLLNLLLQKYAPQHLDPVMAAVEGITVSALGNAISKVEGLPTDGSSAPEAPVQAPAALTQSQVQLDGEKLRGEEQAFEAEAQSFQNANPEPSAASATNPSEPSVSQEPASRLPLFTR